MKLIIAVLIFTTKISYAQNITLSGVITDIFTGEALAGVNIKVTGNKQGASSNNYGYYSISLPVNSQEIEITSLGYKKEILKLSVKLSQRLDIELKPISKELEEVTIKAKSEGGKFEGLAGKHTISVATIKSIPSVGGEPDLMKTLQFLPGVKTANEGTTNLAVRGGSYDQTLILLDEAPVYNPSHALGFFSTFNPDAIKSLDIYKGYLPAQYGGRLSSVVDIRMKEGNKNKTAISGGIGLIASRLTVEAPILNRKGSFIFSGRYSYAGQVVNGAAGLMQVVGFSPFRNFVKKNVINFYDLNFKANYETNNKNKFYLSLYSGLDNFNYYLISRGTQLKWGNTTGTLRWNHIFGPKLFSNTSLISSRYRYEYSLVNDKRNFDWMAGLSEVSFKQDYDYFVKSNFLIKFGLFGSLTHFMPGSISPKDSTSITKPFELDKKRTAHVGLYISAEQSLSDKLKLEYGLRQNFFGVIGPGKVYKYGSDFEQVIDSIFYKKGELISSFQGLEPRISLKYAFNQSQSFQASITHTKQYMHLLTNSSVGLPTDIWTPADTYLKPQTANQFSIGYSKQFAENSYNLTVELYHKKMNNVIDFIDNSNLFLNSKIESQIKTGVGKAYGAEFFLEKKQGKLLGWVSYTLSKTQKQIEEINQGIAYSTRDDRRHSLSIIGTYPIKKNLTLGSNFVYNSGGAITLPTGSYTYHGATFSNYTERNGFRTPAYHRLDISLTLNRPTIKKIKKEWVFTVYNVYNRANVFSIYQQLDEYNLSQSKLTAISIFGIVPSVTYNFSF